MHNIVRRTINYVNHKFLHPLDVRFGSNGDNEIKPIFIIGAPRSGSTLLSQVLISAFDLGYFSNLHAYFFGAPDIPQKLLGKRLRYEGKNFDSRFGDINGLLSPSECGEYWYRFFRRSPQYVRMEDADPEKMDQFRRSITRFTENCKRPVLFKNMLVALRLRPVIKCIPGALFIIIRRNLFENAQSLLEARIKIYGNANTWWSMEPPGIDTLKKLPPPQQVLAQIQEIHSTIESDLRASGIQEDRVMFVDYEDFCSDTHDTLHKFESFCKYNGLSLNRTANVPKSFIAKKIPSLPDDVLARLQEIVDREQRYS